MHGLSISRRRRSASVAGSNSEAMDESGRSKHIRRTRSTKRPFTLMPIKKGRSLSRQLEVAQANLGLNSAYQDIVVHLRAAEAHCAMAERQIQIHRRQLHAREEPKGGKRKKYTTKSLSLSSPKADKRLIPPKAAKDQQKRNA